MRSWKHCKLVGEDQNTTKTQTQTQKQTQPKTSKPIGQCILCTRVRQVKLTSCKTPKGLNSLRKAKCFWAWAAVLIGQSKWPLLIGKDEIIQAIFSHWRKIFFARVRTPCGRCAQIIVEGKKTQHIDGGKEHRNQHQDNSTKSEGSIYHPLLEVFAGYKVSVTVTVYKRKSSFFGAVQRRPPALFPPTYQ